MEGDLRARFVTHSGREARSIGAMRAHAAICLVFLGGMSSVAIADKGDEPPIHFEVGLNTRHFTAIDAGGENTAFRGESSDPSIEASAAVSVDLRFMRWLPRNFYAGLEAEVGKLEAFDHSNLAAAYAVVGSRVQVGFATLSVEMAAGQRKVRYGDGFDEESKLIAEPRVRGEMWLGPRVTLGGAIGTTLGSRDVWMAGVYVGVHSLVWGKSQP
jgi:hypothetical protein